MIDDLFSKLRGNVPKPEASDRVLDLLDLCAFFGVDRDLLSRDLIALMQERLLMQLIGTVPNHLNYGERQRFITRRLRALSGDCPDYQPALDSDEVLALTQIQQAVASAMTESKDGVSSLDERSAMDIMERQGYRCGVCGSPLRASVRKTSLRFPDHLEPLAESAHLDHVIPHYFFGNEGGRRVLCGVCNSVKNDRIGVQEDGFVVCGNHIRRKDSQIVRRRMIFWTLESQEGCSIPGCNATAAHSTLFVEPKRPEHPFSYGNLKVLCEEHATASSVWVHK